MHDLVDTLVALNHSFPKQKLTKLIMIQVGNPDDCCTQNCLPQDCLPVGNSEVGNPEGNTLYCLPQDCLLVGNPEVGNSECMIHQDCLPWLYHILWTELPLNRQI